MRGKIEMRSDYGLYSVAVICFIISAVFAANLVPGYQLGDPLGLGVTAIFLIIGIISLAVGYLARPKAMMPTTQPMPKPAAMEPTPEPSLPESQSPQAPEPEAIVPTPLPSPMPSTTPEPSVPEPSAPEPTATETNAVETSAETVQPAKVEEIEKPKPTRRRRKKIE